MLFAKGKTEASPQEVTEIAINTIALNPHQPRQSFNGARLEELAASIKEHGIIQPIVVRKVGETYELVVGERRLRAAKLAGLKKVPAIVREMGVEETAVVALIENLQREDLNVIEEARSYRRLLDEFDFTQAEVGRMVGKGQSTIANKLRLLKLPERVQARVLRDGVSERHARALLDLPDETWQMRILDEATSRGLSVRETEERIRAVTETGSGDDSKGSGDEGRRSPARGQLAQVSDRRAIRAFRDIRLFLNTFRRAVDMLKEAGVRAELVESDSTDFLEVKVIIPKNGATGAHPSPAASTADGPAGGGEPVGPAAKGRRSGVSTKAAPKGEGSRG